MGNVVTREKHGQTGALLAKDILEALSFDFEEVATIMGAIANHEEAEGRTSGERRVGRGDHRRQERRASKPRAEPEDDVLRHPRPRELRGHSL